MAFRFTVHESHFLATAYIGLPVIVFHRLNGKCGLVEIAPLKSVCLLSMCFM